MTDSVQLELPAPAVRVPDIRTAAPSAPGSESSRKAAGQVTNPYRMRAHRLVMLALEAA